MRLRDESSANASDRHSFFRRSERRILFLVRTFSIHQESKKEPQDRSVEKQNARKGKTRSSMIFHAAPRTERNGNPGTAGSRMFRSEKEERFGAAETKTGNLDIHARSATKPAQFASLQSTGKQSKSQGNRFGRIQKRAERMALKIWNQKHSAFIKIRRHVKKNMRRVPANLIKKRAAASRTRAPLRRRQTCFSPLNGPSAGTPM